jgi:predicted nucleic acid-binding protein
MVRFWDTSALVPLVVEEATSASCRHILRKKAEIGTWALTRTEMVSAVWRRSREGDLGTSDVRRAVSRIDGLAAAWTEVTDLDLVRDRAERLLAVHVLRAADALQLAAALVLVDERTRGRDFVVVDGGLADAATAEGFNVIIPRG